MLGMVQDGASRLRDICALSCPHRPGCTRIAMCSDLHVIPTRPGDSAPRLREVHRCVLSIAPPTVQWSNRQRTYVSHTTFGQRSRTATRAIVRAVCQGCRWARARSSPIVGSWPERTSSHSRTEDEKHGARGLTTVSTCAPVLNSHPAQNGCGSDELHPFNRPRVNA